MGNCATCRFWGWADEEAIDNSKDCQLASDWPKFEGQHPLVNDRVVSKFRAMPGTGSDYAFLVTDGDFGCVQWQPKKCA